MPDSLISWRCAPHQEGEVRMWEVRWLLHCHPLTPSARGTCWIAQGAQPQPPCDWMERYQIMASRSGLSCVLEWWRPLGQSETLNGFERLEALPSGKWELFVFVISSPQRANTWQKLLKAAKISVHGFSPSHWGSSMVSGAQPHSIISENGGRQKPVSGVTFKGPPQMIYFHQLGPTS